MHLYLRRERTEGQESWWVWNGWDLNTLARRSPRYHSSRLSGLEEQWGVKRHEYPCRSWPEPALTSDTPCLVPLIFQKVSCGFYEFLLQINGVKDYKHLLHHKRWQLF